MSARRVMSGAGTRACRSLEMVLGRRQVSEAGVATEASMWALSMTGHSVPKSGELWGNESDRREHTEENGGNECSRSPHVDSEGIELSSDKDFGRSMQTRGRVPTNGGGVCMAEQVGVAEICEANASGIKRRPLGGHVSATWRHALIHSPRAR